MGLRAVNQLRENVRELMRVRGLDQKSVSFALGHHPTWINKFLKGTRPINVADLDGLSDLFGFTAYQLFQPGIAPLTERRKRERRSGRDRRIGHQARLLVKLDQEVARAHPHRQDDGILITATEWLILEQLRKEPERAREGLIQFLHIDRSVEKQSRKKVRAPSAS